MRNALCVSIMVKKGVCSIILMTGGRVVSKSVTRIKDEDILGSSYRCLIHAFTKALRVLRSYIDNNPNTDKVVFEVNNSTFIKWVYASYSKEAYQDLFEKALELLDEIPVQYMFSYSKKPTACMYLSEVSDNSNTLSGLFD